MLSILRPNHLNGTEDWQTIARFACTSRFFFGALFETSSTNTAVLVAVKRDVVLARGVNSISTPWSWESTQRQKFSVFARTPGTWHRLTARSSWRTGRSIAIVWLADDNLQEPLFHSCPHRQLGSLWQRKENACDGSIWQ